ncbi:MAG: tyrosine-type recombinase/integrase [Syntrophobacteraceae bacterium]|jgi:integrase
MRGNPQNHPKNGDSTTVEPIRNPKDIEAIKKLLQGYPRDLLLFTLGINNGLRVGDLLKLRVWQVRLLKPGQSINIREGKTGKQNILMVNKSVHRALQAYLSSINPSDDDFLFASRTGGKAITIQRVNQMIKGWTKSIHLQGNFGSHSLRKTFGYAQRTRFGIGFEILAKRFNHSSPSITMRYLGVQPDEVNEILLNEI